MANRKRGQAALEFLTTYGWAFLVILVMIGALAYFGVLDPTKFIPQRCQVSLPLTCDGENYKVQQAAGTDVDPEFKIRLRNSFSKPLNLNTVSFKDANANTYTDCPAADFGTVGALGTTPVIQGNSVVDLICANFDENKAGIVLGEGQKQRVVFQINYEENLSAGAGYDKTVDGEIFMNIE